METKIKLEKLEYLALSAIALVCIIRAVTLYYWVYSPDIELSSSPTIYKGVNYPMVSVATLIIGIPCLVVLLLPFLRSPPRVIFISGMFVSFGIASIIASIELSLNVAGGGGMFVIAGMHLYRTTTRQIVNKIPHSP